MITINTTNNINDLKQALDRLRPVILKTGDGHIIKHKNTTTFVPFSTSLKTKR